MKPGWGDATPRGDEPRESYRDPSRGPRLHKVLAEAGVGSRRACEELIASGAVAVNGQVITKLPAWVDPVSDRITVDGERIRRAAPPVYFLLNKPRGVVCTNAKQEDRRRAIDLVPASERMRLYTVGRLDVDSSGLLLLTNDGDLAQRLTHPSYGVHKCYEVIVDGSLDEAAVRKLESGVFLPDRRNRRPDRRRPPARRTVRSRLRLLRRGRDRTKLLMELHEGRNRQIRRMMLHVGHPVRRLRRVQLGPLKLANLRPGQWRELSMEEVKTLRNHSEKARKQEGAKARSGRTATDRRGAKKKAPRRPRSGGR